MLDEIAARAADAEGEINNINLRLGQTLKKAVRIRNLGFRIDSLADHLDEECATVQPTPR
jgi:hypothetical protein